MENLLVLARDAIGVAAPMIRQYQPGIDIRVEQAIKDTLSVAGYPFLGEETGITSGSLGEYQWVVDPIDGTANLVQGLPEVAISIGLVNDQFQSVLGVIHAPFLGITAWAMMENNSGLSVSQHDLAAAVIAVDWTINIGYKRRCIELTSKLHARISSFRSYGSSAVSLYYVAAGKLDAFIHVNPHPWDVAAGMWLVQSAGGMVTNIEGRPYRDGLMVASNGKIHDELLDIIV